MSVFVPPNNLAWAPFSFDAGPRRCQLREGVVEISIGCATVSIRPADNGTVEIRRSAKKDWEQIEPEAAEAIADALRAVAVKSREKLAAKRAVQGE